MSKQVYCDRCSHPGDADSIYCSNEECTYHEKNKCPNCGNPSADIDGRFYCACVCSELECTCGCCGQDRDKPLETGEDLG